MKLLISLLLCVTSMQGLTQCAVPTNIKWKNTGNNSMDLTWDNIAGATFAIQYKKTGDPNWLTISGIPSNSYSLLGLDTGTSYDVQVQTSCSGGGVSAFSPLMVNSTTKADENIHALTPGTIVKRSNAFVLSTNFSLPIVRFNATEKTSTNNAKGNTAFFNSLGAGISVNFSRLRTLIDKQSNQEIETDVTNIIGVQLGVLYAANTSTGNSTNIFAPTISITVLDFQFGYGYEFGTKPPDEKRDFFTIAYGIPLYKITDAGAYVFSKKEKDGKPATKAGFVKAGF